MNADLVIDTARRDDGAVVVSVEGELDMSNAAEFRQKLLDVIGSSGQAVVVDLSSCGFIDSSGLNVLVHASRAVASGSPRLTLVGAQPHVLRVLEITHVDDLLDVSPPPAAEQDNRETFPTGNGVSPDGSPRTQHAK